MVLRGREADRFERRIEEDLKRPTKLIPTPKLEEARKLIFQLSEFIKGPK